MTARALAPDPTAAPESVALATIPASVRTTVRGHAQRDYPREACGFLLGPAVAAAGHASGGAAGAPAGAAEVTRAVPAPNEHPDAPRTRYLLSPRAHLAAELAARAKGLEVVGFYHSHPDAPAAPSPRDRAEAIPGCLYLIVAVRGGIAGEMTAVVPRP